MELLDLPKDCLFIIANMLETLSMRHIVDGTHHWERDGFSDYGYNAQYLFQYPYKHQPLVSFLTTCKYIRKLRSDCKLPVQYIVKWKRR